MPARRDLLSAPTYRSLTGGINWSRGMDERLATPSTTLFAPPVQALSTASATVPAPSKSTPPIGGGAYTRRFLMQNASE